ncbi:MAG: EI24 domain-containing protein [Ferruginibacter sp.]
MLKDIVIAIQAYFKAHRFIVQHRLWKWIFIPGLLYALMFGIGGYFFIKSSSHVIEYLFSVTGINAWVQKLQQSWLSFLVVFGRLILHVIFIFFYFSLFKYLFLIIGSPLFAYLSEKTEAIMEGREFPFNFKQFIKDVLRGVKLALRNTLWQTVYTISILILSFIPLIGWATPVLALLVECYYFGFSMLDYSCERKKLSTSQSIAFIGRHKGLAIGNGIVFYLLHGFIFIGWIFAPCYAVIAATISLYDDKRSS